MARSIRFDRDENTRVDAVRAARATDHWSRRLRHTMRAVDDSASDVVIVKRRECRKGER